MASYKRLCLLLFVISALAASCKAKEGEAGKSGGASNTNTNNALPTDDPFDTTIPDCDEPALDEHDEDEHEHEEGEEHEEDEHEHEEGEEDEHEDEDDIFGLQLTGGSITKFALDDDVGFSDTIEDLLQSDCVSCHASGSVSGELHTYEKASAAADKIAERVADGSMPPTGKLSDDKIEKFLAWADQGAPKSAGDTSAMDSETVDGDIVDTTTSTDCDDGFPDTVDTDDHDEDDHDEDEDDDDDTVTDNDLDELVNPEGLEECHDDKKVYDRIARECHVADLATSYDCDKDGVKKAFDKIGVDIEPYLDDLKADDFDYDQCGELSGDPVVMFLNITQKDGVYKLRVRKICKKGSPACGAVNPGEEGPGRFVSTFKTSTKFFKATETTLATTAHAGGKDADIWYSTNIKHLLGRTGFEVPEGTVAIKEYKDAGNQTLRTVMIKKDGTWEYDKRNLFGTIVENGEPLRGALEACIQCHGQHKDVDYLPYFKTAAAADDEDEEEEENEGPGRYYSDFKTNDEFFKGTRNTIEDSEHPGATDADIWYSTNLRELIGKPVIAAPEGSVAIKEYTKDGKIWRAVMAKRDGKWEYNLRDKNGTVEDDDGDLMIGELATCMACHNNYAQSDKLPYAQDANP